MNQFKSFFTFFLVVILIFSCEKSQEARKPVSHQSGSFVKKSIERNKKLVATEEGIIDSIIKSQPKVQYLSTKKGYWYTYKISNKVDSLNPKKGDIAFFEYEIKDLKGRIIYSQQELKPQIYAVDKQNIMSGLREGIKIMRKKEKIEFLFPSHIAFGYHGDEKKIGPNTPLRCTVTLHNFMPEIEYKKQIIEKQILKKAENKINDTLTN